MIETIKADPVLLLIPVFAGIIGWFTNVVAIKMMFKPIEFVGIKPFLGWQGIVPANALRLATTGLKLVTEQLLDIKELFDDFDSKKFVGDAEDDIDRLVRKVIEDKAEEFAPAMWKAMAPAVKDQVVNMAKAEVMKMAAKVFEDMKDRVTDIVDVEGIVVDAITADKELLNRIFLRVGEAEFKFIARSGLYFGFIFGIVQLFVWIAYPAGWMLPLFGFLVGYATNWLALKLIFEPREPKSFGKLVIQGLFHRRQKQISREFSKIVSSKVFSTPNIYARFTTPEAKKILLGIVKARAEEAIEPFRNHPMAKGMIPDGAVEELETELLGEIENELFREGGFVYQFADKSEQIRTTLLERMSVMDPEGFENVLRPAFKQDEWKLILAGAVLGGLAGLAQVVYLFGDMVM